MANIVSLPGRSWFPLLHYRDWFSYVVTNPKQAAVNAYLAYKLVRYTLRFTRHLAIQGVSGTCRYLYQSTANWVVKSLRTLPGADRMVHQQVSTTIASIEKQVAPDIPGLATYTALPANGLSDDQVVHELERRHQLDTHWRDGKQSGTVYHGGEALGALVAKAYAMFSVANPLHPDVFPGLRKMEAEVVAMVLQMYNAPPEAVGTTTSGGTESIIMSVRAHLVWARQCNGIKSHPEMVVPVTVHAAFEKAAEYFGITLIQVPVDAVTQKVDLTSVKRAISRNTIMIVGSAPNFPNGVIDDIKGLSDLAVKYRVGLHVDCCLGGFLLPFMAQAGYGDHLPPFDFRLPGVTAISCDTHKYGFAPKGSSVILYRSKTLRHCQYFVTTDWTGGIYASPTIAGSRPGALIAGCWAAMVRMGEQGYIDATRQIIEAARQVKWGIQDTLPELYLVGDPWVSVVAFSAHEPLSIYGINDVMNTKGWGLSVLQFPSC
ncbi:Dihydrosphingosine phosphate lyase, partial [Dimargaris xerosporica]